MRNEPTGTVTFLFTDIEGSTRLWERDEGAMRQALARHDEILQSTIEDNSGFVFKTVGDAFCAAFSGVSDALEAALASQRALSAEGWEEGCEIRARMAIHTGAAQERGGDYFGPPVNRVARLLSAGHGGQTLVSHAARELAGDRLPTTAAWDDLGEHRLKDLSRPERIFQVLAAEHPATFPALKTLDVQRNNLPAQLNPLVGREREISEVCERIREPGVRLLTLTGPGGTGKTRLGLQAAADLLDEYQDGVFFVALADTNDTALVPATMARALGVSEVAEMPLEDVLREYLARRSLLMVLDNFEQILEAAPLVGSLLADCSSLKVLATSRAVLRVYGEQEYPVPPLTLPDPGRLPPVEMLERYEAVRLFAERARAVKPGFVLDGDAPAVAEICTRLDGLPLAIELAAARTRLLPPKAILKRLGDRLKLLTGGAKSLPARQRTLRGAIEWSHDLLDEGEKTLFARLAVFSGGRTLEAMEEICDAEGDLPVDVFDGVSSLLEKSLIKQEEGPEDEPRFVMLETIHEFAREKLEESGEVDETKRLHAEYFLALAEEAEPELVGPDQAEWMDRLEAEHDNFRAALSWSLQEGNEEIALKLGASLDMFWFRRGHVAEGEGWLEQALSRGESASPAARAAGLWAWADLLCDRAELDRACKASEEALELYREVGDAKDISKSLSLLAFVMWSAGRELERAENLSQEALALARESGDAVAICEALNRSACAASDAGDRPWAAMWEEALALAREKGFLAFVAVYTHNLGYERLSRGDPEGAMPLLEEALAMSRRIRDSPSTANTLMAWGFVELQRGSGERAEGSFREVLETVQHTGHEMIAIEILEGFAELAGLRGAHLREATLWGATEALREAKGFPRVPEEQRLHAPFLEAALSRREADPRLQKAWEEGGKMTLEGATAFALEDTEDDEETGRAESA